MPCLKVQGPNYIRVIPEGPDGNVRGMLPTERIVGVEPLCGPYDPTLDFESLIGPEGVMIGNVIKKVTNAVGIKQCLSCRQRQHRYNQRGLKIQRAIKDLF